MMDTHFFSRVETLDDVILVRLAPRGLSEENAKAAADELFQLAERWGQRPLHLDLGAVEYLTSTGLGQLVGLHKRVRAARGRLVLLNVPEPVYELLNVTRLNTVLEVYRS